MYNHALHTVSKADKLTTTHNNTKTSQASKCWKSWKYLLKKSLLVSFFESKIDNVFVIFEIRHNH
jgi:hypothetical protein